MTWFVHFEVVKSYFIFDISLLFSSYSTWSKLNMYCIFTFYRKKFSSELSIMPGAIHTLPSTAATTSVATCSEARSHLSSHRSDHEIHTPEHRNQQLARSPDVVNLALSFSLPWYFVFNTIRKISYLETKCSTVHPSHFVFFKWIHTCLLVITDNLEYGSFFHFCLCFWGLVCANVIIKLYELCGTLLCLHTLTSVSIAF
jgi:hypothetical protein